MASYFDILASGALSIEDDAAFDFTDDVEIRWDALAADWNIAANIKHIFSRYDFAGGDRVLRIYYSQTAGRISADTGDAAGAFRTTFNLSASPAPVDGNRTQFRVTIDADNGGNTTLVLYTRTGNAIVDLENSDGWTQVATAGTTGVQAWKATADPLWVGSLWDNAASQNFSGRLYRIMGWTDLTQTTKFIDVDFTDVTNQTTAGDASEWNDAASANTWDAQGTEGTDWQYVRVKLDNLVDPESTYDFDVEPLDMQPFRGKAKGTL